MASLKLGACFAAGTKLLTPLGWWPVEELYEGMLVRSRPEDDPHAETRWNAVEATFVRSGRVLHLHVGGEVIRTAEEHPFYEFRQGWTAAGALQAGDWVSTLAGGWAAVEEVYDTGCYETVYNIRVAEDHTYYPGTQEDHKVPFRRESLAGAGALSLEHVETRRMGSASEGPR